MYDILTAINNYGKRCSKWEIQKGSSTEYLQMNKYLKWAISNNLVAQEQLHWGEQPVYTITERGIRFIELVLELKAFIGELQQQKPKQSSYSTHTRYTQS